MDKVSAKQAVGIATRPENQVGTTPVQYKLQQKNGYRPKDKQRQYNRLTQFGQPPVSVVK